MTTKRKAKAPHCTRCGRLIVWLQETETPDLEMWRGCQWWVVCDYRETML